MAIRRRIVSPGYTLGLKLFLLRPEDKRTLAYRHWYDAVHEVRELLPVRDRGEFDQQVDLDALHPPRRSFERGKAAKARTSQGVARTLP